MYLHEQQESRELKKSLKLCFARPALEPALWYLVKEYLDLRGLTMEALHTNGWYPSAYDSVPRLIIPCQSMIPKHLFWQGRNICRDQRVSTAKRYDSPHCSRADALVVCYPAKDPGTPRPLLIVEGPFDALAVADAGGTGVALMGCTPSNEVLDHLKILLYLQEFYWVPDRDSRAAFMALSAKMAKRGKFGTVKPLNGYKDFAEMPRNKREEFINDISGHPSFSQEYTGSTRGYPVAIEDDEQVDFVR